MTAATAATIQAFATAVLVIITGVYAWQNQRIVEELRRARKQEMLPRIVIKPVPLGPTFMVFEIVNVGPGPALDARLSLTFEPRNSDTDSDVREWVSPVIASGESYQIMPSGEIAGIEELGETYAAVRLQGMVSDVFDERHPILDEVDVREWWSQVAASNRRVEPDYIKKIADEVKKVRKEAKKTRKSLGKIETHMKPSASGGSLSNASLPDPE